MRLISDAFENNRLIPSKYACDGANISPPLRMIDVPEGTKSLALICDDPDAPVGIFVHWVMYNIPSNVDYISENVPKIGTLPDQSLQGINSFEKIGYDGPCPPSGTHRYFFKLYALDDVLGYKPQVTKELLLRAMQGHIIEETELIGLYEHK